MSCPTPVPEDPASSAADEAPDPSVLRAERRLRLLEELTEIGMELARALRPRAPADGAADEAASMDPATENGRGKGRDPADAFARLSRAVRLTLALEAKTDQALRDLKSGIVRVRDQERARPAERAGVDAIHDHLTRQARVCELVESVAEAEIEDEGEFVDLCEALEERLKEDEAYVDCDEWPLRETVERLCKDLALTPDWSRWTGEGWTLDDPHARSRFSPFREPSRRPVLNAGEPPPLTLAPSGRLQPAHHLE